MSSHCRAKIPESEGWPVNPARARSGLDLGAAHQVVAQVAAYHLAGRRVEPPPSKSRVDALGDAVGRGRRGGGGGSSGSGILWGLRRALGRLRLQGGGVDSIGVETLVDGAGLLDEV